MTNASTFSDSHIMLVFSRSANEFLGEQTWWATASMIMRIAKLVSSFEHCKLENHKLFNLFQIRHHTAVSRANGSQN
ncbi:hypothetical protein SUGI_1498230 [Cryptomeria japonica]|uniref:Uncharacterized protein n=1 Tax=Cryptomeria japonica TaxID=3369 RepID=A0AAD3NUT2_CRYJA|nr:hypothetical protein SUGI_1477150 [Cryptomeria japonica]GLJ59235.1 hypothetical protein SUGI_1498230 [Cryptomeria japonica]